MWRDVSVGDGGVGCVGRPGLDTLTYVCLLMHLFAQACLMGIIINVSVTTEEQSHPGSAALT